MNYDVPIFKDSGNTQYDRYLKKIVRIVVDGESQSMAGRLIEISERFLTLQHRNGLTTTVRAADIITLAELPEA